MSSEEFKIGPWTVLTKKSHILKSRCELSDTECPLQEENPCAVCKYSRGLELPSLPEMVFPNNTVKVVHECGVGIEFNAFDALRMVDQHKESLTVAASHEWMSIRREGLQEVKDKVKPFDWTFTTLYQGTLLSRENAFKVEDGVVGIDYNKLKVQEKILFYEDMMLFEDELADNGIAQLRIKIRVMASGFFILLRFFLRVDDVIIRIHDTRLYHSAGSDQWIKEFSVREAKLPDPTLPLDLTKDINKISEYLPHKNVKINYLLLPENK